MDLVEERPLKLYFIPYLAAGHIIPLCDIARFFASRGHHVTIVTTPSNAKHILPTTTHFHVHTFPFPSHEVGLPGGVENLTGITDLDTSFRIYHATMLLREPIENFMEQNPPDCIVADFLYPWVDDLANKLRIPRFAFNGFSLFAICAMEAIKPLALDSTGSFVIPDFPHHISIRSSPPKDLRGFLEPLFDVAFKSNGFIINNFAELDGEEYIHYYEKITGHKAWHLGPACLIRKTVKEKAERGNQNVLKTDEFLSWLNSKRDNSVAYISFGTICCFSDKQLYEIACGVEAAGHEFIWVVPEKKGKEEESLEEKEKWLPKGFEERNRNTGMIIRGWAPQVLILSHRATGAFVTHCGWNSTVEAVSAGVPMITWPVHSEQFFNEKLISQVRGIGVEVGVEDWALTGLRKSDDEKVVTRDRIEKAVRRLMDGSDEAQDIRRRARQFGEKARQAVQEGWAPQVLILSHPAVGAFVSHCGCNSTVEAVSAGVPMITWPVQGEQLYNEKLVTQVRGIGVEVGATEWRGFGFRERDTIVNRESVEKAMRKLMDGGDQAEQIRRRAQLFGKKAKEAIKEGGSSHKNLTALIEDLKRLRRESK